MGSGESSGTGEGPAVSLPVVLRDAAQVEFDDAFDYYEAQRPGRGVDFAVKVQDVFDRIAANPQMHPVVFDPDVRKALVIGFPYCVFYQADAAMVDVISVFHTSRDPSIWQGRV